MMRAMVLERPGEPLVMREGPLPSPGAGEILATVSACGVCRTDLHVVDGELPHPKLPVVPGHEIVGRVAGMGARVAGFALGERIGIPWLGYTCGQCVLLSHRPREPVRSTAVHRLHPRRRLCHARDCRC